MFLRASRHLLLAVLLLVAVTGTVAAQERFKNRKNHVRIAIQHDVGSLALEPRGEYKAYASTNKELLQLTPLSPCFVQITKGQPGGKTYRLVIRELGPHTELTAINDAKAAKSKYKLPVKVLRIPAREAQDERIMVTLGEFPTPQSARDYIGKLPGETIKNIYEERSRAEKGEVRLVDRSGKILARDPRFIKLIPQNLANDSLAVQQLGGKWTAAGMKNARHYRGDMELTLNEEGTLTAVNDLWIEYYLYSVVACEIGGDAPAEALKAQAVAARSEAVAKYERGIVSSSLFDFFDTDMAQVYKGKGSETAQTRKAVDGTRGELLVWNGEPVDAVYGHSCGGLMASSNDIWDGQYEGFSERRLDRLTREKAPDLSTDAAASLWLAKASNSLCNPAQAGFPNYSRDSFYWTKTYTGEQFSKMMNASYGVGTVRDVVVERRVPSGRVRKLRIIGSKKSVLITRELEIRGGMGDLYSTFFVVDKQADQQGSLTYVRIRGAGFGHGVGLCQMGAYMMGLKGYNYRQILAQYFRDVRIRRMY